MINEHGGANSASYQLGRWIVDPSLNQISDGAVVRHLEPRAMEVLVHLMSRPEMVVSSEELLQQYWTVHTAEPRKIAKRINQIRKALGDDARHPQYIETIPKRGYRIVAPVSLRSRASPSPSQGSANKQPRRVAVLPFANLFSDQTHEHVSDGMTAELIARLSQIEQLDVLGRSTVMPYRDTDVPIAELARKLGVELIITGTIAVESNRYRATVEVMSARIDSPLWASAFENDSELAMRREIAQALAGSAALNNRPAPVSAARPVTSLDDDTRESARSAYQNALSLMGTQDHFAQWLPDSIAQLEYVTRLDPEHAEAWTLLALLQAKAAVHRGRNEFETCKRTAQQALLIDCTLGLPYIALGYASLLGDWNLIDARAAFDRALKRCPDNPSSLLGAHLMLRIEEREELAEETARQLLSVAPHDFRFRTELPKLHYESRHYEQCVTRAVDTRKSIPGYVDFSEAAALQALGRFTDSYNARLSAYRLLGEAGESRAAALQSGWQAGGYVSAMQSLSDCQFSCDSGTTGLVPHEFVVLPDRIERMFALIEHDIDRRQPTLIGMLHAPDFDELRLYPQFTDLLDKLTSPRPEDGPAKRGDVARIQVFRGQGHSACEQLTRLISEHSSHRHRPRWMQSLAWACFAIDDFEQAVVWTDRALDHDLSRHARAFVQLVQSAALSALSRTAEARRSFVAATQAWPGMLHIDRDVEPLFFARNDEIKERFVSALHGVSNSIAPQKHPR